jgi:ComF family protein
LVPKACAAAAGAAARRLAGAALAALFPADCLLCAEALPWRQEGSVCLPCWEGIAWAPGYRPALPDAAPLAAVAWAADYDGAPRRLIHGLKFEGMDYLGPPLGRAAAARLRPLLRALPACDLVVPVPLHPLRRLRRGFNQSLLLAREFAAAAGAPLAPRLLRRAGAGGRQVGLGRSDRLRALQGRFRARAGAAAALRGARVLLVDDVTTTGATLLACARALEDGGAAAVVGCVVARTP